MTDPINPAHYRQGGIETYDFIEAKGLNYAEGNVVKYVTRWRQKGGVEDLEKARWYLDRLIQDARNERVAERQADLRVLVQDDMGA